MKIKLSEFRRLVKSIIKEEMNKPLMETEQKIGAFSVDLDGSPASHEARVKASGMKMVWENINAWDLFASPGTKVNAYVEGVVTNIIDKGNGSGVIYGVSVAVKGSNGEPDAFYAHLTNPQVKVGSKIQHGTYLGDIARWNDYPQWSHVHIALSTGHLRNYMNKPTKTIGYGGGGQYRDIY